MVVRSNNGMTETKQPDDGLRSLLRTNPEAFLARKVIVCEGKTEIGFCRALDAWWSEVGDPLAYVGAAFADGQGNTNGPSRALEFAALGYQTAFFGDSDMPLNPDEEALRDGDVTTFVWEGGVSIEERVALDLPWNGFVAMALLVLDNQREDHVQAMLAQHLDRPAGDIPLDPEEWRLVLSDEAAVRAAFGKAAKARRAEWFKRVDRAEKLGEVVTRHWDDVAETPLGVGIALLRDWAYD